MDEIDAREFGFWRAYYSLEPFGELRADVRTGHLGAGLGNLIGNPRRALRPRDFMPDFETRLGVQSAESMARAFASFAKLHNAGQKSRG